MIGIQNLAMLEGAFERTRAYTKDRMVFGKPLIKLQVRFESVEIKLFEINYFRLFNIDWQKSKPKQLSDELSVTLP